MASTLKAVLFLVLLLAGIFAISTFAFLRWSRRFRRWMFHKSGPPTPSDDVWRMHRLPEDTGEAPDVKEDDNSEV